MMVFPSFVLFVTTLTFCPLLPFPQSRSHYRAGRYAEAERSSKESLYFNKLGCVIGITIQVVVWVVLVVTPAVLIVSAVAAAN